MKMLFLSRNTIPQLILALLCLPYSGIGQTLSPAPAQAPGARIFRFVNLCSQTIWVGAQGNPLPQNGGWEMAAGDSLDISLPDNFSAGRFWARTGCVKDANGILKCETGDCVGKTVQCAGIGGESPATLAEFTLGGSQNPDIYDISLVDGFNIGLRIDPFGNFQKVNNNALGKFNCGSPVCPVMDFSKCPKELLLTNAAGKTIGCLSVCAAVNNTKQVAAFPILAGYDTARVCCSCDCGAGCGCSDPRCKFGCSPLDKSPGAKGGKCFIETWPRATNGMRYDSVFKSQVPDAYSWQFDDMSSTFSCMRANYKITFTDKPAKKTVKPSKAVTGRKNEAVRKQ